MLENCINFQSGSKKQVPDSNHTRLWKFSKENSKKPKFYCFLCSCLEIKQAAGIPLFVHLKACSRVANGFLRWINNVPSKIIRSLDLKEVPRRRTSYSQTKHSLTILEERNCYKTHAGKSKILLLDAFCVMVATLYVKYQALSTLHSYTKIFTTIAQSLYYLHF